MWRHILAVGLVGASGCSDYNLFGRDDDNETASSPDTASSPGKCDLSVLAAGTVEVDPKCVTSYDPVADPWSLVVEWSFCPGDGRAAPTMPVVGLFRGDPVVAVAMATRGTDSWGGLGISALHGATGEELWRSAAQSAEEVGLHPGCSIAMGDLDGDGHSELVGVFDVVGSAVGASTYGGRLVAFESDGTIAWESPSDGISTDMSTWGDRWGTMCTLTIADLEGDGSPEVVTDWGIYDGKTGVRTVDLFASGREGRITHPVVADLDRDGVQEVLLGEAVYGASGELRWTAQVGQVVGGTLHHGTVMVPVELDGDAAAEILALHDDTLSAYDTDGSLLYQAALSTSGPVLTLPCLGDFDGDGRPELGYTAADVTAVVELDGTELWSVSAAEAYSDRVDGCSAADLDGDGAAELLELHVSDLILRDGRTGEVLATAPAPGRGGHQLPVVADVDGDGAAEIVVVVGRPGECTGVTVFGHGGGGWGASDALWGMLDQADGKQGADGSVGTSAWWRESFRGRRVADPMVAGRGELALELTETCVTTCDEGLAHLAWSLANSGGVPLERVRVQLRADDGAVLAEELLPPLAAGERLEGRVFVVPVSEIPSGEVTLEAVTDEETCLGVPVEVRWTVPCGR